ncbi:MAG: peptide deformylase [Lachnospiraceae bacterium]|nr:peptide deformylase [Lachnospiraceae bacterium]
MALRTIRTMGDPVLEKKAKEVTEMTERLKTLIADMLETMYEENGVGLAAPQVGVLKRIVVIDVSEERNDPHVLVNPVITETEGEQTGYEGCLSVPGKVGMVTRPERVVCRALDENMQEITLEGTELLGRAIAHELDHLEGRLYVDLVEGELVDADTPEPDEEDVEE